MTDNKPVHSIKLGTIEISLWLSENELGRIYRLSAYRLYKDNSSWGKSRYFTQFDLPLLLQGLQQCQEWLEENANVEDDRLRFPKISVDEDETSPISN